jgi:hypothetical protein
MAASDEPVREVGVAHRTARDGPPILIYRDRNARDRSSRDEGSEIVGGFRPAAILQAIVAPAELCALRCVDAR